MASVKKHVRAVGKYLSGLLSAPPVLSVDNFNGMGKSEGEGGRRERPEQKFTNSPLSSGVMASSARQKYSICLKSYRI